MAVKDFMSKKVVFVSPETKVAKASELMKANHIHRLPVIENDKLIGLVTEGSIKDATPSKATSLSIYEMNYLLNKTTVKDVMIKDVVTISRFAMLEDAIYAMRQNNIGVLPVVDDEQLYGIITDKDIFDAFLEIAGYGHPGLHLVVGIEDDSAGELAEIAHILAQHQFSIDTIVVLRKSGKLSVEIQIKNATVEAVEKAFVGTKYPIISATLK